MTPVDVLVVCSVIAGVALVHGARVQCALLGDGGLPGTRSDWPQWKFRPAGTPTENLTWFAGPRQATITTFL
jgi:hypothetical protein